VPHFVYLAVDGSTDAFGGFLRDHAGLLRCLPRWVVVAVGLAQWPRLQTTFDTFIQSRMASLPPVEGELSWYFERRIVERGDLAQVSGGAAALSRPVAALRLTGARRLVRRLAHNGSHLAVAHPGRPRATRPAVCSPRCCRSPTSNSARCRVLRERGQWASAPTPRWPGRWPRRRPVAGSEMHRNRHDETRSRTEPRSVARGERPRPSDGVAPPSP
jgi:hypothetical protein